MLKPSEELAQLIRDHAIQLDGLSSDNTYSKIVFVSDIEQVLERLKERGL